MIKKLLILSLSVLLGGYTSRAQERVGPLMYNGLLQQAQPAKTSHAKTTALTLPFFEDFTIYSTFPDDTKWTDRDVYINNTMAVNPISRGVATFDGLNSNGLPYDPNVNTALVYADSLTSRPFDLSGYTPGDSIYLSFFYQPQGNGFYPEGQDSLMLYFKKSNDAWIKVWAKEGTQLDSFKQVLVAVKDTVYLHSTFQFCFLNKASMNTNDDVWNVDYIKLDAGRNMNDTLVDDVAFTVEPSFYLNDYTSMPYRQFKADPDKERATQHSATIRNGYTGDQSVNYGFKSREKFSNTPFVTDGPFSASIGAKQSYTPSMAAYNNMMTTSDRYANFTYEDTYYLESTSGTDRKENDTIVKEQLFYNYLAYDDGTAERSYYLNLFPTLPGKTAIEFHLNEPDTLSGISIYFGRQVPMGYNKYFSVAIYKEIAMSGSGSDQLVYQEDFLQPAYLRNDFYWTYKFENPVPLPAGTFYMGTIQPALSNSDSLYIGLDVNRQGSNHAFYNVVGYWQSSTVKGALMIRPVLGPIIPSNVPSVPERNIAWNVTPNPATDRIQLSYDSYKRANYELVDMQGRTILKGAIENKQYIDIQDLVPGMYFVRLTVDGFVLTPQKIVKY